MNKKLPDWMGRDIDPTEFEHMEAKTFGGKRHKGSGALWYNKRDASSEDYLIECKTTGQNGYRLMGQDLKELLEQAADIDKSPIFSVLFNKFGIKATIIVEWSK